MTCPHCAAQMVPDHAVRFSANADYTVDLTDARSAGAAWRCLCGQYLDRAILANRARQADELRLLAQVDAIVSGTARRLHDYGVGPRS